jgi:DNA-binding IclR family transcriptional regulator
MRHNPLHQVAHPYLQQLAHTTGERVTLEALTVDRDGRYTMLVLDEIPSVHMLGVNQFVGSRLPVHATSTGKAVLAFLPAAEQQLILHSPLPKITEQTRHTAEQLQAELFEIRQKGYALAIDELELGLMAASAPIFNHNQESYTAVCIVGPSVRLTHGRLLELAELAQQTAHHISHQLGYRR